MLVLVHQQLMHLRVPPPAAFPRPRNRSLMQNNQGELHDFRPLLLYLLTRSEHDSSLIGDEDLLS